MSCFDSPTESAVDACRRRNIRDGRRRTSCHWCAGRLTPRRDRGVYVSFLLLYLRRLDPSPDSLHIGFELFGSSNRFDWETLFTGQRYDALTGLYLYRMRYYQPQLGRFVTRDPLEHIQLTNSDLYIYTGDSPIFGTDPSGLLNVHYQSGKGSFDIQFGANGSGDSVESDFTAKWIPAAGAFPPNQCSCDTVGFVQVAFTDVDYSGISGWFWEHAIYSSIGGPYWHLDRSIPYPNANPASHLKTSGPARGPGISMRDTPGFTIEPGFSSQLISGFQLFQTCVACLSGKDGIKWEQFDPGAGLKASRVKDITVYGCITWGHEMTRITFGKDAGKYSVTRRLAGPMIGAPKTSIWQPNRGTIEYKLSGDPGNPPTDAFKKGLELYFTGQNCEKNLQ